MSTPQQAIAFAWRVQVRQRLFGQDIYNVMGVTTPSPIAHNSANAQAVATQVRAQWNGNIMGNISADVTFLDVTAISLQDPTVMGRDATPFAGAGRSTTTNGATLTSAVAYNVSLRTARRGRRYMGRTGIAGAQETDVTGNFFDAGAVSRMQTAFDQFRGGLSLGGVTGGTPVTLAVISNTYRSAEPVTSSVVQARIGTRLTRLR